jgi:anti-sigma factor RsiW
MSYYGKDFRTKPARYPQGSRSACAAWSMLLPDAADGLLSDAETKALDQHLAGCAACSHELAEAQRGLAWLTVLKDQAPEPPDNLLANILAQTTGMPEAGVALPPLTSIQLPAPLLAGEPVAATPVWQPSQGGLRGWFGLGQEGWSGLLQPRLAMTGAMAFFSICLTLNLLGVSVRQLDAQSLRNGGIHRTVTDTGASLVRSIQGLRTVYRVESRVNEMRAQMDGPDTSSSNR